MAAFAVGLSLCLCAGPVALQPAAAQARAKHAAKAKKHRLSGAERRRIKRVLLRDLRRNPTLILNKRFMRKASLVDFSLPMSVRLSSSDGQGGYLPSDDQMEIAWDDSAFNWPFDVPFTPTGTPAAPQIVTVGGSFTLEGQFNGSDTSGYGEPGDIEATFGGKATMTATQFHISEFLSPCANGPQLEVAPGQNGNPDVTMSSVGPRYGVINPFTQEIRGALSLQMFFTSNYKATCDTAATQTDPLPTTATTPIPIRFSGKFNVSPGITADGKIRFGKFTVDDTVTPQLTTFAFIQSCTGSPCNQQAFPSRIKFTKLTGEILLGDVFH